MTNMFEQEKKKTPEEKHEESLENAHGCIQAAIQAGITDRREQALFLGQIQAETGNFMSKNESFNYRDAKHFEDTFKGQLKEKWPDDATRPQKVVNFLKEHPSAEDRANMLYGEGQKAYTLGNLSPEDGYKYRGRGYIQLTGRDNYTEITDYMNSHHELLPKDQNGQPVPVDFVARPDDVLKPEYASKAAAAFWMINVHSGYERAVANSEKETDKTDAQKREEILRSVTKPINSHLQGLADRREGRDEWEARERLGYDIRKSREERGPDPLALLNKKTPTDQVGEVQKELHDLYPERVQQTGIYDQGTRSGIKALQADHPELGHDGAMGPHVRTGLLNAHDEWLKTHEVEEHTVSDMKQTLEHAQNTESQTHPLPRKFPEPQQNDEGVKIRPISATPEEMHKTALRDVPAALHQGTYEPHAPHEALHKAIAPLLKEGSQGDYVLAAQVKLSLLHYTGPNEAGLLLDGKFGAATEHAVREFQKASGLTQDGMIGAHTGQALDKAYKEAQKYGQSVSPQGMKEAFKPVTTGNKATQAAEPEKKLSTVEEHKQKLISIGYEAIARRKRQEQEQGLTETQDYTQSRGRGMRMR